MSKYMSPEEIAAMAKIAGIEDPAMRMNTFSGMQSYANQLPQMGAIRERSNGRVVGRTSPMEGLGQLGSQLAGAYMSKNLMDKYGSIMDANNQQRMSVAQMMIDELRKNRQPSQAAVPGAAPTPNSPVAQSFPIAPQSPAQMREIPALTPYEIDYYGGY